MCKPERIGTPSVGRSLLRRLHKPVGILKEAQAPARQLFIRSNTLPVTPSSSVVTSVKLLSHAPWYMQVHRHMFVAVLAMFFRMVEFAAADIDTLRNFVAICSAWLVFEAYLLVYKDSAVAIRMRFHASNVTDAAFALVSIETHHATDATRTLLRLQPDTDGVLQGRKSFSFRGVRYVYNGAKPSFEMDYPVDGRFRTYLLGEGLRSEEVETAEKRWGSNVVRWPTPALSTILWEYLTKPHFVFTILLIILAAVNRIILARVDTALEWLWHIYLGPTLGICALIRLQIHNAFEKRVNALEKEKRICKDEDMMVEAMRDGKWTSVSAEKLFPYDLVKLTRSSKQVPCDGLLLRGMITVSEALITGESANLHKVGIDGVQDQPLDLSKGSAHLRDYFLYGGATIVSATGSSEERTTAASDKDKKFNQTQTQEEEEEYGVMFVLKTGNATRKGEEFAATDTTDFYKEGFRALLWPMALFAAMNSIRIMSDVYKYWAGIYDIAPWGLASLLAQSLLASVPWPVLYIYEMDLRAAANALFQRFRIVCIDHNRIPQSARIDVCCFDKTGTLTTARMNAHALTLLQPERGSSWSLRKRSREVFQEVAPGDAPLETKLVLAACHSLVGPDATGDPKEEAMFAALPSCVMKDLKHVEIVADNTEIEVVSKFPFESTKAYMSVVVGVSCGAGDATKRFFVLVKGKAEKVRKCLREKPAEYDQELSRLSRRGFHVWALAVKEIQEGEAAPGTVSRDELEAGLDFAGFLMLENELRFDTIDTLNALKRTGHELKMITGDHILTASHVAIATGIAKSEKLRILEIPENPRDAAKLFELDDYVKQPTTASVRTGRRWPLGRKRKGGLEVDMQVEVVADAELPRLVQRLDIALDGTSLENLRMRFRRQPSKLDSICRHAKVFARVLPAQKEEIVAAIKSVGLKCLMCGDGLNDVRALGRADIGVSISTVQGSQPAVESTEQKTGVVSDWVEWLRPIYGAVRRATGAVKRGVSRGWSAGAFGMARGAVCSVLAGVGCVQWMWKEARKVGISGYIDNVLERQELEAERCATVRAKKDVTDVENMTMVVKSAHYKLFGSIGGIKWIVQSGRLSTATLLYKYNSFLLMKFLGVLNYVLFGFSMIRLVFLTSILQILVKDVLDISAIIKRFKGNDKFGGPAPIRVESRLNVRYLFMQCFVQASTYVGLKLIIENIPAEEFPEMPDYVRPWSAAVDPSIPNAIFFYTWICVRFNTRFAIFPDQYLDNAGTYSTMVLMMIFVFSAIFATNALQLKPLTAVYAAITMTLLGWNTIATWIIEKRWKRAELKQRVDDFEFDLKHSA